MSDIPSFAVLHLFVFVLALMTALLEIQIEGPHGWAQRLPTWRFGPMWYRHMTNGKELTGYHLSLMVLQLLYFHLPTILFFQQWNWPYEFLVLSLYFLHIPFWDFLWFICNPVFGWRRFSKEHIWWFSRWLGPFPVDYYFCIVVSTVLISFTFRSMSESAGQLLSTWFQSIALFLCVPTLVTVLLRSQRRR